MKKTILFLLAALLLAACGSAPEAVPTEESIAEQLAGKYQTTITGDEPDYNPEIEMGDFLLKLQDDLRWYVTDLSGFIFVQGYYTATADQIVFETKSGPASGACIGTSGSYAWSLDGGTLTLTAIEDDCVAGKFFLTAHPFVLQP
ncbi:MAG: hypothetical protein HND47_21345 [Chloroflexi bacterium]|nr:hypothetical protein [Chloroflexota bacterium]